MDKKKVIELIEDTILMVDTIEGFDDGDTEQLLNVRRKLNGALDELSKPDWISVEDELPPYEEDVLVMHKAEKIRRKNWDEDLYICNKNDKLIYRCHDSFDGSVIELECVDCCSFKKDQQATDWEIAHPKN